MTSPRNSIRRTLTTRLLVGLLCLSGLVSAATFLIARQAMVRQFDYALLAKAKAIASLVEFEDDGEYEFEFADEVMSEYSEKDLAEYFQIWLPDATVLERSRSLMNQELELIGADPHVPEFRDLKLPNGTRGRAVEYRFMPRVDRDDLPDELPAPAQTASAGSTPTASTALTVIVAQPRESLDKLIGILLAVIGGAGLLVPTGSVVLVLWSVHRGLRPLDELAAQVHEISASNLDHRLAQTGMPAEIQPVVARLNDLLDRLQTAFDRERRFTSDVSHELRTPIAEARLALELATKWPGDTRLREKSYFDAIESLDQMQALVTRLLLLVKSDSGKVPLHSTPIDLSTLTESLMECFQPAAARRNLELSRTAGNQAWTSTDQSLLTTVLRNLLDNAVEYAPPGTAVKTDATSDGDWTIWRISNDAPDLSPNDVREMFVPFWRKDESRTGDSHSGIGLSLVENFCRLLQIDLLATLENTRLTVTLRLPGYQPADLESSPEMIRVPEPVRPEELPA